MAAVFITMEARVRKWYGLTEVVIDDGHGPALARIGAQSRLFVHGFPGEDFPGEDDAVLGVTRTRDLPQGPGPGPLSFWN